MDSFTLFLALSHAVDQKSLEDLRDEKNKPKPKEEKPKKKEIKAKEPKPVKEARIKTVELVPDSTPIERLDAASSSSSSDDESYDSDNEQAVQTEDKPNFKFAKLKEKKEVKYEKGKNKFQKLRQAQYEEKLAAENPDEANWDRIKRAAAGERVEMTSAQLKKSIKKDRKEKEKRKEKRKEKVEKQKKKEERERKAELKKMQAMGNRKSRK